MKVLGIHNVDSFVDNQTNLWMENYTIIKHTPSPKAVTSRNGVFNRKTGEWGFVTRIDPDQNGKWQVYGGRSRR